MSHMISISLTRTIRTADKDIKRKAIDSFYSLKKLEKYKHLYLTQIPKDPVQKDGSFTNFISVDATGFYDHCKEKYDPFDYDSAFDFYLWQRKYPRLFEEFCDEIDTAIKRIEP